jgi:hypothetical protein
MLGIFGVSNYIKGFVQEPQKREKNFNKFFYFLFKAKARERKKRVRLGLCFFQTVKVG